MVRCNADGPKLRIGGLVQTSLYKLDCLLPVHGGLLLCFCYLDPSTFFRKNTAQGKRIVPHHARRNITHILRSHRKSGGVYKEYTP